MELMSKISKLKPGEDSILWCPDSKGSFPYKSAWDVIRDKGGMQNFFDWVWHPLIPKKVSFMIWKGLHKALSVDLRIKEVGINLASKCNCCESPSQESEEHILSTGDFVDSLWRKFDSGLTTSGGSLMENQIGKLV
ncbi:uncharacterized protein LOC111410603 [Olea europaea var. sylvestris]|uniref:uncharacterized protein LOC111410603 n=1 Tax=Olea europaea var. sylvestris TaxID=158386 RepID=UPI000C1CDAEB|nr:uncharacterized protein LOC111410603 [Olea europaea var. sylvestris]